LLARRRKSDLDWHKKEIREQRGAEAQAKSKPSLLRVVYCFLYGGEKDA
jgi:hypothetical protein